MLENTRIYVLGLTCFCELFLDPMMASSGSRDGFQWVAVARAKPDLSSRCGLDPAKAIPAPKTLAIPPLRKARSGAMDTPIDGK